ncbi:hypothetical protein, partial [Nocardiopsis lucentensis]|uniref:hypothetical protein n=1 Tax=Nocardiopsis lucentensis TaxID=53441 RepID=UPI000595388B
SRRAAPEPAADESGFLADVPADTAALAAPGAQADAPSEPGHDEDRADGYADYDAYADYDGYDDHDDSV